MTMMKLTEVSLQCLDCTVHNAYYWIALCTSLIMQFEFHWSVTEHSDSYINIYHHFPDTGY